MIDLASHILDLTHNAIRAGASIIDIVLAENTTENYIKFEITDNGRGMDSEMLAKVSDPFYTTRKSRKIGLGLSLMKQNAEQAGGALQISSQPGKGTQITARLQRRHIDCPAKGDIAGVITSLACYTQNVSFNFTYIFDDEKFTLKTAEIKDIMETDNLAQPEIRKFINEMITENMINLSK